MREDATICALSTPIGVGGLAVIRVSGPEAILCCERIFKGRSLAKTPNSSARHGFIIDPENGEMIDEVIALVMRGPNNFTGEDTVEIDCHGGMYICRRILEALIKSGCRMAMPGEFSKRAFLNGRMDLTEAEAVMDMINAETAYSLKAATSQLQGGLSKSIEQVRLSLLDCIVKMEVNIDYPEYDVPEITDEEVQDTCGRALAEVEKLRETADSGRMLRDGIGAALVGSPNVGKSSLLNLLLGSDRAIVTEIPGTTRDVIEEKLDLSGIPIRIMDTAGIREASDIVEKIGVERSYRSMEECDLILWVVDAIRGLSEEELSFRKEMPEKPFLVLLNKTDSGRLDKETLAKTLEIDPALIVEMSAKEKTGIPELTEKVKELFFAGEVLSFSQPLITNLRQKEALMSAKAALERVRAAEGMPQDLLVIDIRDAAEAIGEVTGKSTRDEVITEIFSRFCLGK